MIARTPWLRLGNYDNWWSSKSGISLCGYGLNEWVRIPRKTTRIRICASDRRPIDDRDVFEILRSPLWPDPRWFITYEGEELLLPAELTRLFVKKFPRWRTLHVWVEVE